MAMFSEFGGKSFAQIQKYQEIRYKYVKNKF